MANRKVIQVSEGKKINIIHPETGAIGEADPDTALEAIKAGYKVADPEVEIFNPETGNIGKVSPEHLSEALDAGYPIVGTRDYKKVTTGGAESLLMGGLQGVTAGFADEIGGAIGALSPNLTYAEARDALREKFKLAEEANPKTFKTADVGGSIASLFLPVGQAGQAIRGVGLLAKGGKAAVSGAEVAGQAAKAAGLGQRLLTAAELGGMQAAGLSEADLTKGQYGDFAQDVGTGALFGGATELGTSAAGKVLGTAGKVIKDKIVKYFDPETNRYIAFGAMKKELKEESGKQFQEAVKFLEEKGVVQAGDIATEVEKGKIVFKKTKDGLLPPNTEKLIERIDDAERVVGEMIGERYKTVDSALESLGIPLDKTILDETEQQLVDSLVYRANPATEGTLNNFMTRIKGRLEDAKTVTDLWKLKQDVGEWVKPKNWENTPPGNDTIKVLKLYYGKLNDKINEIADAAVPPGGSAAELADLNRTYSAIYRVSSKLDDLKAREDGNASVLGARFRDSAAGASVATGLNKLGAPGWVSVPAGVATAAAGKFMGGTTSGRLLRAQIGENIPRETAKIKEWLGKHYQGIMQDFPQMQSQVDEILSLPDAKAAIKIKALMPVFSNRFQKSDYPSLLDGKVTDPKDKLKAQNQIEQMGLPPTQQAKLLNNLNSRGELPKELYTADDNINALVEFAEQLKKMGY